MLAQVAVDEGSLDELEPSSVPVGVITLDRRTRKVTVAGRPVALTTLELALLSYLFDHPGLLHSRDSLLGNVWPADYDGGKRTVDIHVARLRRKLGPGLLLKTLRGVGYRLELPRVSQSNGNSNEHTSW